MSTPGCAVAKRRGQVTAPNRVPVTEARVLKNRMRGNSHGRFGSSGKAGGNRHADRNQWAANSGLRVSWQCAPIAAKTDGGRV